MKLTVTSGVVAQSSSPKLRDAVPGDIFWITDERWSGDWRGPFLRYWPGDALGFVLLPDANHTWSYQDGNNDIRFLAPGESITITRAE